MSNLYTLTKKIHELLPQVKAKYGLKFEVEFKKIPTNFLICKFCEHSAEKECFKINPTGFGFCPNCKKEGDFIAKDFDYQYCFEIKEPQIRQILVGLQEILGENPIYKSNSVNTFIKREQNKKHTTQKATNYEQIEEWFYFGFHDNVCCQDYTCFKLKEYPFLKLAPKSQDEALDDKWLRPVEENGKYTGQSLFNREPVTVLHELVEILENLLEQAILTQKLTKYL